MIPHSKLEFPNVKNGVEIKRYHKQSNGSFAAVNGYFPHEICFVAADGSLAAARDGELLTF